MNSGSDSEYQSKPGRHGRFRQGQFGFMLPAASATGQQILFWDHEDPRTWTIHLTRWRYQGGTIGAQQGNQTTPTLALTADGGIFVNSETITQAAIQFGVGGGSERAVVDYPMSGTSFEIACASFKMQFLLPNANTLAAQVLWGAFAVPSVKDGSAGKRPPKFTTQTISLTSSAGGQNIAGIAIPDRARSYTLAVLDAATASNNCTIQQMSGAGNVLRVDHLNGAFTVGNQYESYGGSQVFDPDIHPNAQTLLITNTSAGFASNFVVSFELDLG